MKSVFDKWLMGGAVVLIALLLANAALMLGATRKLGMSAAKVAHTREVISTLESLQSLASDAESGQRGFVITGEPRYLDPFNAAVSSIHSRIDDLERLTADDPVQQSRFPSIRENLDVRLKMLNEGIAVRKEIGFEPAQDLIMGGLGKVKMDALRADIRKMIDREQRLLHDRTDNSARTFRAAIATALLANLVALGAVAAFIAVLCRHLKARAVAIRMIAEQGERLRTTLASIGDAVITTDTQGRVTNLNAMAEVLTGWTNDDARGQSLEEVFRIVDETTREAVENPVVKARKAGKSAGLANYSVLIARDGTERGIDNTASPIRSRDGTVVGFVLVFRDITERIQNEAALRARTQELAQADRRKDEFLAMLAHELRNPLAPLRNAAEIFRAENTSAEERAQALRILSRQIENMGRMIDDLLDVSRITEGKIELRRQPVALEAILTAAASVARAACATRGQQLTVTLPAEPVFLNADATRLEQVFNNLLGNACKYSGEGCHIALEAELAAGSEPPEVIVRVRDDGAGIDPELLPRIFDLFVQASRTLDRAHGGLGIGLTLVERLVDLHGGSVEVHSEGLGHGSEFIVRLPVLREAPPAPQQSSPAPLPEAAPRRILIVDDNTDSARSLAILQSRAGHETRTAFTGPDAVAAAAEFLPDVVLLDIGLPGMNGFEVARQIRTMSALDGACIIAMSGYGRDEDRDEARAAGFDDYLVKPIDLEVLREKLRQHA